MKGLMRFGHGEALLAVSRRSLLLRSSTLAMRGTASTSAPTGKLGRDVPSLKEFLQIQHTKQLRRSEQSPEAVLAVPVITEESAMNAKPLNFFIETYGCQMNVSDSEVVRSVLMNKGYQETTILEEADIILTNTCAVRDNAEQKVHHRLKFFQNLRKKNRISPKKWLKKDDIKLEDQLKTYLSVQNIYPVVGVLGCMAERMKEKLLLEDSVDFIVGPDAYRDIPRLVERIITVGEKQSNIALSFHETYSDITPIRDMKHPVTAFTSIMRGCNNMCSFCIVPFTRGRERSRPLTSIIKEIDEFVKQGIKEITLLGQNVNGYHDTSEESIQFFENHPLFTQFASASSSYSPSSSSSSSSSSQSSSVQPSSPVNTSILSEYKSSPGFQNLFQSKKKDLPGIRFAHLLFFLANLYPDIRIRFTSPHPKDFPEEVIDMIATHYNICSSIHLPIQSGSSSVLERMRRGYTQEAYLSLIKQMKEKIPRVCFSTDIITGFCDETEEEHQETLKILKEVRYDQAFMFAYSLRDKTHASYNYKDNVTEEVKQRRLEEIISTFRSEMLSKTAQEELGNYQLVLVEEEAAKSTKENVTYTGRTDGNRRIVFPATDLPMISNSEMQEFWLKQQRTLHSSRKPTASSSSNLALDELLFGNVNNWSDEMKEQFILKGAKLESLFPSSSFPILPKDKIVGQFVLVKILKAGGTIRGVAVAGTTMKDMKLFSEFVKNQQQQL
jgi:tRNA A37 methylthiotransferase MiaB